MGKNMVIIMSIWLRMGKCSIIFITATIMAVY